jgi:hypothetical protein
MKKQQVELVAKAGFEKQNKNTVIVTADRDWLADRNLAVMYLSERSLGKGIFEVLRNRRLGLIKDE